MMFISNLIQEVQFQWDTHLRRSMLIMTPVTAVIFTMVTILLSAIDPAAGFPQWLIGTLTGLITILLSVITFFLIQFVTLIRKKIADDDQAMKDVNDKLIEHSGLLIELKTKVDNLEKTRRVK